MIVRKFDGTRKRQIKLFVLADAVLSGCLTAVSRHSDVGKKCDHHLYLYYLLASTRVLHFSFVGIHSAAKIFIFLFSHIVCASLIGTM